MDKTMEELKAEATSLGLDFKGNISKKELGQLIEDHYESQAADDFIKVQEVEVVQDVVESPKGNISKDLQMKLLIAKLKAEALKKRIVTISSNDKRTNDIETTAYLSMENQHFSVGRYVPLDIPVELEQCLIDIALTTVIILHRDEITTDGKRTGNKVATPTRKFNVSFQ